MGINHDDFDSGRHHVVSNASCTTNCLAPLLKVIDDEFRIRQGFFTTVHAYTAGQKLLDKPQEDLRRARGGAGAMIPTTTGVLRALYRVLPGLGRENRRDGDPGADPECVARGSCNDGRQDNHRGRSKSDR